MRLYEYEGKQLLARHGLRVPRGALWPDLPDGAGPWVVKPQVLGGRRGKRGAIRFATDREGCRLAAEALIGSRIGDQAVEQVYVEERVEIERELYLAILLDRDRRAALLLASRRGGVDVEEVPEEDLVQLPISPLLGLRSFATRHVVSRLGLSGEAASQVGAAVEGLYSAFRAAEALLVEVNPLALTREGRVITVDAKVELDDEAAFRHPERPTRAGEGTRFEQQCAALGPVGVEMEGEVVAVVAGAGLMMATVDLLSAAGVRLRAAVDTAGIGGNRPERFADLVRLAIGLRPRVIFINAFYNLAKCDLVARAIAAGFAGQDFPGRVVLRLKGRNLPEARALLRPLGFAVVEDLGEAIELVVAAAGEAATCPS